MMKNRKLPAYRPKLNPSEWKETSQEEMEQVLRIVSPELHDFVVDHYTLSRAMDEVRKGYDLVVYRAGLTTIEEELQHHFHYEEILILPRLESHIPTQNAGPAYKIRQEHALIRKHHAEANEWLDAADPSRPDPELVQRINLLAYLLKKHIEKENHYLLPLLSLVLTAEEKRAIADSLPYSSSSPPQEGCPPQP